MILASSIEYRNLSFECGWIHKTGCERLWNNIGFHVPPDESARSPNLAVLIQVPPSRKWRQILISQLSIAYVNLLMTYIDICSCTPTPTIGNLIIDRYSWLVSSWNNWTIPNPARRLQSINSGRLAIKKHADSSTRLPFCVAREGLWDLKRTLHKRLRFGFRQMNVSANGALASITSFWSYLA